MTIIINIVLVLQKSRIIGVTIIINIVMVLQIVGIIGVTGREQEDLKRCQEAIQLTWLLVHTCYDDDDDQRVF